MNALINQLSISRLDSNGESITLVQLCQLLLARNHRRSETGHVNVVAIYWTVRQTVIHLKADHTEHICSWQDCDAPFTAGQTDPDGVCMIIMRSVTRVTKR